MFNLGAVVAKFSSGVALPTIVTCLLINTCVGRLDTEISVSMSQPNLSSAKTSNPVPTYNSH